MEELMKIDTDSKSVKVCKTMATLSLVAACVAIITAVIVVIGQSGVKQIFRAGMLEDIFVVPYVSMTLRVIKAVLTMVCMVNIKKFASSSSAFTFAMISVIGCVIVNILSNFTTIIDMNIVGALGTPALASMSAITSALRLLSSPFDSIAFIFSCIVLGITIAINTEDNQ